MYVQNGAFDNELRWQELYKYDKIVNRIKYTCKLKDFANTFELKDIGWTKVNTFNRTLLYTSRWFNLHAFQ